jgi:hypothetical protein
MPTDKPNLRSRQRATIKLKVAREFGGSLLMQKFSTMNDADYESPHACGSVSQPLAARQAGGYSGFYTSGGMYGGPRDYECSG